MPDEPADRGAPRRPASAPGTSRRSHGVWDEVRDLVRTRQDELGRPLRVLDLGGGTGGLAVPLAELGHDVTVVDPSPNALAALQQRAADSGVADRVHGRQGDADDISGLAGGQRTTRETGGGTETGHKTGHEAEAEPTSGPGYDLVCCHGVLEVVDDPASALRGIAAVLAPDGHLSLLVAGRLAVVLAKALAGEVEQATAVLTSPDGRWGRADPLPRRFDVAGLTDLLERSGFAGVQVHGVRVFADLVPSSALDSAADRAALAALEQAVSSHPHYAEALGSLGTGLHALARRG